MRPLEGITVVSVEQAVAAPFATRQLADLGARVIKVEHPDGGDFARVYDTAVKGLGAHFVWLNRSKESLAVDLKTGEGREVLRDVVRRADVFVQNLAPGAAARLGFSADTLRAEDPGLVVVDMSGYGSAGPYRDRKAYDLLVECEAGLVSVTGTEDGPVKCGVAVADIAAGVYAFSGVLAALVRRARTGDGASLEITMFDALTEWMGHPLYTTMYTGSPPPRSGLSHPAIAPYDAYPTSEGAEVVIGIQNDRGWRQLVGEVFDRPDLADNPDYATNIARCANREKVDAVVAESTSRFTAAELVGRLNAAGVPAARLNTMHDVVAHPQLAERDRWREVDTPAGPVRAVLPPITFGDVEATMGPIPAVGEHTERILSELGHSSEQVAGLVARGVVGR